MAGNGMWGWGMGFGGVWMVLLLIGLIALTVWLVRFMFPQGVNSSRPEKPLEIAQRRYAKGEISQEEFEALKRDLA